MYLPLSLCLNSISFKVVRYQETFSNVACKNMQDLWFSWWWWFKLRSCVLWWYAVLQKDTNILKDLTASSGWSAGCQKLDLNVGAFSWMGKEIHMSQQERRKACQWRGHWHREERSVKYSSRNSGVRGTSFVPPQLLLARWEIFPPPASGPFTSWQVSPTFLLAHTYLYPSYSPLPHVGPLTGTTHFTLKMEVVRFSKTLVSYCSTT
jgi:hypothetical protein